MPGRDVDDGFGPVADVFGRNFADRDEPVSAVVERMATLPMDAQPGERFIYGYNTDILGVVVETVSGKTLAEFFERRYSRRFRVFAGLLAFL